MFLAEGHVGGIVAPRVVLEHGETISNVIKCSERDLSFEKKERTHYRPLYLPSKLRMRKSLAAFYLPSANYKHYVLHDASEREVSVSQRDPT